MVFSRYVIFRVIPTFDRRQNYSGGKLGVHNYYVMDNEAGNVNGDIEVLPTREYAVSFAMCIQ